MEKLLVIEDDAATADFVVNGLREAGHTVDHAGNGRDGLFLATDGSYACIVLDRLLPGLAGMAVLAALRGAGVVAPVIVLSALGAPEDRVRGLTSGADDYLTKPFTFAELHARISLLVRRGGASATAPQTVLAHDDLQMDLLTRRVRRAGQTVDLQPREFRLLEFLLRHAEQVVTRTMLLEGVWDYHFDPGTNVIDVHLSRLRRKVDDGFAHPLLHTVRGVGYRLGSEP